MKRIITALGNTFLNDELKRYSKYDVLEEDFVFQEALLDYAKDTDVDVIVVSGLLQGDKPMIDFVTDLKAMLCDTRIILIVDNISSEDKNILISKGIFDILYDEKIEISDVIEAIDRETPINLRAQIESEIAEREKNRGALENITDITTIVSKVQKQEIIGVFGTNGAGKSSIIANLVKAFSRVTKAKILLIDFDTLCGNLHEVLGVDPVPLGVELIIDEDKRNGINFASDLFAKNKFDMNVLEEIVIKQDGFEFLSGNTSLHICQNVLNEKFYSSLIKCAKEKYDFIFLDLSSNVFLDSTKWALRECTKVLFVTENTSVCLKKSIQLLDTAINVWNVYKEKFSLVINRYSASGIDVDIFSEVLKMKSIGCIKNNMLQAPESYEKILETLEFVPKNNFLKKIAHNTKMIASLVGGIKS
jgi:MinD-like ATPase involved in chromosome partitioning or flagellar assembly